MTYLARLAVMARIVESTLVAPSAINTEAMARIAALAADAKRRYDLTHQETELGVLLSRYVNRDLDSTPERNTARMLANAGLPGAVISHEVAHAEASRCAMGSIDSRHIYIRNVLEELSCRTLPDNEVRADMRAMDVAASEAGSMIRALSIHGRSEKEEEPVRHVFLGAVLSRVEYEAIILPDPDASVSLYKNEPQDANARFNYYLRAGFESKPQRAIGHVPPELRPLLAFTLLFERGFIKATDVEFVGRNSLRLRAYVAGVMAKHCGTKEHAKVGAVNIIMSEPLR